MTEEKRDSSEEPVAVVTAPSEVQSIDSSPERNFIGQLEELKDFFLVSLECELEEKIKDIFRERINNEDALAMLANTKIGLLIDDNFKVVAEGRKTFFTAEEIATIKAALKSSILALAAILAAYVYRSPEEKLLALSTLTISEKIPEPEDANKLAKNSPGWFLRSCNEKLTLFIPLDATEIDDFKSAFSGPPGWMEEISAAVDESAPRSETESTVIEDPKLAELRNDFNGLKFSAADGTTLPDDISARISDFVEGQGGLINVVARYQEIRIIKNLDGSETAREGVLMYSLDEHTGDVEGQVPGGEEQQQQPIALTDKAAQTEDPVSAIAPEGAPTPQTSSSVVALRGVVPNSGAPAAAANAAKEEVALAGQTVSAEPSSRGLSRPRRLGALAAAVASAALAAVAGVYYSRSSESPIIIRAIPSEDSSPPPTTPPTTPPNDIPSSSPSPAIAAEAVRKGVERCLVNPDELQKAYCLVDGKKVPVTVANAAGLGEGDTAIVPVGDEVHAVKATGAEESPIKRR